MPLSAAIFNYHQEIKRSDRKNKIIKCKNISNDFFNCVLKDENCKEKYEKLMKCLNSLDM